MKRIILSRKGFDSSAGEKASPIFSNGNICSIPIPDKVGPFSHRYRDLKYDHLKIEDVFEEVDAVKPKLNLDDYCHFDPQLNQSIGLFGQLGFSQKELDNQGVGAGDIFLFFGWFRNYSIKKRDLHHLFGWLQIDRVLKDPYEIKDFLNQKNINHPHGATELYEKKKVKNNTLYVSKEFIEINNKKTLLKGFGLFKKTHHDLILTDPDPLKTRTKWKMPEKYFSNTKHLFMSKRLNWIDEKNCLIDSNTGPGQELILNSELNPKLIDWVMDLIEKHGDN